MLGRPPRRVVSDEQSARYARHLTLPEVGPEGQRLLNEASILVVGAGGLGSPALLYLAAAGIGKIGIIDDDSVDLSNLQRQVLHGTSSIGEAKVVSAERRLSDLNPEVTIEAYEARLGVDNALDLIDSFDLVIDGSDNFSTRYLISDACEILGKPWCSAVSTDSRVKSPPSISTGDPTTATCFPRPLQRSWHQTALRRVC